MGPLEFISQQLWLTVLSGPACQKKLPAESVGNSQLLQRYKQGAGTQMNKKTLFGFGRTSAVQFLFPQPFSQGWGIGVSSSI